MSNDTTKSETPALALAQGSAILRHLIDDGCVMRADDEALSDDCQSWWRLDSHPCGRAMVGRPYDRGIFVPIRRNGLRPPNEIERLLFSPNAGDVARGGGQHSTQSKT